MSLLDEVALVLADADLPSFRLYGEDLVVLAPDRLWRAADEHDAELEKHVPPSLRPALASERIELLKSVHTFVSRYNTSIHQRIRGYVELGRRLEFEYPWPVVAVLGIVQVMRTLRTVHALGLAGGLLERVGRPKLAESVERTDDVLRRTNRGIFADSVPTVLFVLRCHALRKEGREDLARALLSGPRPVWMDGEGSYIAEKLYAGLALADPTERFSELRALTLRHFAREQAIFSYHMGVRPGTQPEARPRRTKPWFARALDPKSVYAPRVEHGELRFAPFALPEGFQMRDHAARVEVLGRAFVQSVTGTRDDYRVALDWVSKRFG